MSERLSLNDIAADLLHDEHLDLVIGGTEGYPGLALGTRINISPWSGGAFNRQWTLVGATGHLPNPQ
jgi:hypothetical protein